jgi:hypothetical protein
MVSILASQYPLEHDVRHMFPRSRERYVPLETLPRTLSRQGYRTAWCLISPAMFFRVLISVSARPAHPILLRQS